MSHILSRCLGLCGDCCILIRGYEQEAREMRRICRMCIASKSSPYIVARTRSLHRRRAPQQQDWSAAVQHQRQGHRKTTAAGVIWFVRCSAFCSFWEPGQPSVCCRRRLRNRSDRPSGTWPVSRDLSVI